MTPNQVGWKADQSGASTKLLEGKFRLHEAEAIKKERISNLAQLTSIGSTHCFSEVQLLKISLSLEFNIIGDLH